MKARIAISLGAGVFSGVLCFLVFAALAYLLKPDQIHQGITPAIVCTILTAAQIFLSIQE